VNRRTSLGKRRRLRAPERGQGLVEFALVVPLFLLMLFVMLDFGFLLYSRLTVEYASREGARVGAALAQGGSALPCTEVDGHVIAAVQRVLQSSGISLRLPNDDPAKSAVIWVRIYDATTHPDGSGYLAGTFNQWTYLKDGGPTVDGTKLSFVAGAQAWDACSRKNGVTPDKIGVAINYRYAWTTPLLGAFKVATQGTFFSDITFVDKTVMNLNPTFP
jgi:TadE-like protein